MGPDRRGHHGVAGGVGVDAVAEVERGIAADAREHTPATIQSDLPAPRAGAPTSHAVRINERSQLVTFELGKEIRRRSTNLLLGDEFIAPRLGASFANAERSLIEGVANETIPASLAKLMSAWHADHLVGVETILVHADFTYPPFGRRASIAAGGDRLFIRPAVHRISTIPTTCQHAAFLLDLFGIVEKGLE